MVTRREVLQGTVAATAGSAFSASAQLAVEPGWFDKPMRWAQTQQRRRRAPGATGWGGGI
jgi:hypothetical protein